MQNQILFQTQMSGIAKSQSVNPSDSNDNLKLKDTCAELESLFIYYLLKEMRATVPKDGLFGGGKGEEMYTSMFDLQMANEIAMKREIGIASILREQMESRLSQTKNVEKISHKSELLEKLGNNDDSAYKE